jgi:oligopeptide transport system permease protein
MHVHPQTSAVIRNGPCVMRKISKSLFRLIGSLCILITICFFLMHVLPGDPFQDEQGIPEEILTSLRHQWGLDQPLHVQFFCYLKQLLHGNLGYSMRYPSEPVAKIIISGIPISIYLGLQALCIALPLGICLGTLSAKYANRSFDIITTLISTLGICIPSFVLAALLQLVFALYIPILPVARWGSFSHTILPSIALATGPICSITRLMRASVMDALTQDFITTARMKGLSELRVFLVHVIPNAFLPVLHYLGPTTANLLVGSFVVERVFGIPGLGQWFVNGVMARDYPIIGGLTLFYSIILFSIHFFIDCITAFIDGRMAPREATA